MRPVTSKQGRPTPVRKAIGQWLPTSQMCSGDSKMASARIWVLAQAITQPAATKGTPIKPSTQLYTRHGRNSNWRFSSTQAVSSLHIGRRNLVARQRGEHHSNYPNHPPRGWLWPRLIRHSRINELRNTWRRIKGFFSLQEALATPKPIKTTADLPSPYPQIPTCWPPPKTTTTLTEWHMSRKWANDIICRRTNDVTCRVHTRRPMLTYRKSKTSRTQLWGHHLL